MGVSRESAFLTLLFNTKSFILVGQIKDYVSITVQDLWYVVWGDIEIYCSLYIQEPASVYVYSKSRIQGWMVHII